MEFLPLLPPHYAAAGNPMRFPTKRPADLVATRESPLPASLRDLESGDRTRRALQSTSTLARGAPPCSWMVGTPPRRPVRIPATSERYPPGWYRTETGRVNGRTARLPQLEKGCDTRSFRR